MTSNLNSMVKVKDKERYEIDQLTAEFERKGGKVEKLKGVQESPSRAVGGE